MLKELEGKLTNATQEEKELTKEIAKLQARKRTKKKQIEGIKTEIQHLGAGQMSLFGK